MSKGDDNANFLMGRHLRVAAHFRFLPVLGLNRFLPGFVLPEVDFVIMLTYTGGQALIAWGVVGLTRAGAVTADSAGLPRPATRR